MIWERCFLSLHQSETDFIYALTHHRCSPQFCTVVTALTPKNLTHQFFSNYYRTISSSLWDSYGIATFFLAKMVVVVFITEWETALNLANTAALYQRQFITKKKPSNNSKHCSVQSDCYDCIFHFNGSYKLFILFYMESHFM